MAVYFNNVATFIVVVYFVAVDVVAAVAVVVVAAVAVVVVGLALDNCVPITAIIVMLVAIFLLL